MSDIFERVRDRDANAASFLNAVKSCVQTKTGPEPKEPGKQMISFKATSFDDEDGVIIGKVSVADVRDREKERATEAALKSATWELAMKSRPVTCDFNHDQAFKCDVVGVWYGEPMPDAKACYVMLKPHDREVYEAAKSGEVIGMSWTGPYRLEDDDEN
jgi:hypothetical protein